MNKNLDKNYVISLLKDIKIPINVIIKNNDIAIVLEIDELLTSDNLLAIEANCKRIISNNIRNVDKITVVFTSNKPISNYMTKDYPKKHVIMIAIASCKGGVGKSTLTVNLARVLNSIGYKIGIVDADIYGPSIPHMLNITDPLEIIENKMQPFISNEGIKSISIGNIIPENNAAIWRGPMTTKTLNQLIKNTNWGKIDILLIDTPPGTGDVMLSLIEKYNLDGVVLISTPQDIALADLKKSVDMFNKMHVPILGIVENMSYFTDNNGERIYIFGQDGAELFAKKYNINLLGKIPLSIKIRESVEKLASISGSKEFYQYGIIAERILENIKAM